MLGVPAQHRTLRNGVGQVCRPDRRHPLLQLAVVDRHVKSAIDRIDDDCVAVLHRCEGTAVGRFGANVSDEDSVRNATEPAISDERDILT